MKLKLDKFSYSFLKHIAKFCETHKLLKSNSLVIALSGGHDSMSLLHIISKLIEYKFIDAELRVICVDHATRSEIKDEHELIAMFCKELGVEHKVLEASGLNLKDSNFEMKARKLRYELIKNDLEEGELCLLAHHLDDCFEWSLMQSFKSSSLSASLGIPVKRSVFERPLFCVSRSQLERYSRINKISYSNDQSNFDIRYERNFVRKNIVSEIKKRYPKYLKHYVVRQLALYKQLRETSGPSTSRLLKREWGILIVTNGTIDSSSLQEAIENVSTKKRGSLQNQIEKFIGNFNSNNIKRGPYTFSGDVIVYNYSPLIIVKKRESLIILETSQISDLVPFIVKVDKKSDSLKKGIEPFQKQSKHLLDQGILFNFAWRNARSETLFYI